MAEMMRCADCGKFYNKEKDATCPYCSTVSSTGSALVTDNDRTMPVFQAKTAVDPVVGWLVCVSGSESGKDYRIHSENNYIGRSEKMDICVAGDDTISRENFANITYDNVDKIFYFTPGESRSIIRLNGKALMMTAELNAYDRLTLGKTEFIFVPLCSKDFDWSEIKN